MITSVFRSGCDVMSPTGGNVWRGFHRDGFSRPRFILVDLERTNLAGSPAGLKLYGRNWALKLMCDMSGNMATNIGHLIYSFMLYFLHSGYHSVKKVLPG